VLSLIPPYTSPVKSIVRRHQHSHELPISISSFSTHSFWLYLCCYSLTKRQESEVLQEVGMALTCLGGRWKLALELGFRKGKMSTICSSVVGVGAYGFPEYLLFLSFRLYFSHITLFWPPAPNSNSTTNVNTHRLMAALKLQLSRHYRNRQLL
jgi:hypothetical protein